MADNNLVTPSGAHNSTVVSADAIKDIDFSLYPELSTLTSESLQKEIGSSEFKKLTTEALLDVKSEISEVDDHVLMKLKDLRLELSFFRDGTRKCNCVEEECYHHKYARVLLLSRRGLIECDDLAHNLFHKKDIYSSFLQEVMDNVSLLMSMGLTNINSDVRQLIKSSFNKAATFGFKSLELKLRGILKILDRYLQHQDSPQYGRLYHLCMHVVNIIEAARLTNDKERLIEIMGLDLDRKRETYYLSVSFLGSFTVVDGLRKITSWLFYDNEDHFKIYNINTIVSPVFITSVYLMNSSEYQLPLLDGTKVHLMQAYLSNDRIINSKKTTVLNAAPLSLDDIKKDIALESLAQLRAHALSKSLTYFGHQSFNEHVYVLHCVSVKLNAKAKSHEPDTYTIVDYAGENEVFESVNYPDNSEIMQWLKIYDEVRPKDLMVAVHCCQVNGKLKYTLLCPIGFRHKNYSA